MCSPNGAINGGGKKERARDSLCVRQVPSHLDTLLPSSSLPTLSSPLLFLSYSSADWCAIHGGPISPFSVLRLLATIHVNEVEQMTFLLWVHGCVRAKGGEKGREESEWVEGMQNSFNLSCLLPNQLLKCGWSC